MYTGKDLIDLGYKPGAYFKEALKTINENKFITEADIRLAVDPLVPQILELQEPDNDYFFLNMDWENEEEATNVRQVCETMYELLRTPTIRRSAVMPDACPTGRIGQIPVGGVVECENAIHPGFHSADICCSVFATSWGHDVDPKTILDAAEKVTHFGPGGRKDHLELTENLLEKIKRNPFTNSDKAILRAKTDLGTQGDGNHFLFVGTSSVTKDVMMVTHHGSRGFGATVYKEGMKVAEKFRRQLSPKTLKCNAWIPFDTQEGQDYWEALQIVRKWTKLNHMRIHGLVSTEVQIAPTFDFWNEHNFVFKKENMFYHAKGATPLLPEFVPDEYDGLRLIPLNMSEPILVVRGEETNNNLGFAPHGAGRNISRSAHKRKFEGQDIKEIIERETEGIDCRFFCGEPDITELPSAYKNAAQVTRSIKDMGLGYVVDRIMPYGSIMAGDVQKNAPWRKKKEAKKV